MPIPENSISRYNNSLKAKSTINTMMTLSPNYNKVISASQTGAGWLFHPCPEILNLSTTGSTLVP